MTNSTLMLRQIHKNFIQNGRVSSQAFRPTPKDKNLLSVYNGDEIQPKDAFTHYTEILGMSSCGVLAVTWKECDSCGLPVVKDPEPFKEHCVIDFTASSSSKRRKQSGLLRNFAVTRGWLYTVNT